MGFSSAAGSGSRGLPLHQLRPSFSRSYGCILPSSLTRVLPRTLGFSPRLPVSVLVRVHDFSLEAFLDSVVHPVPAPPKGRRPVSSRPCRGDLPPRQPTAFDALFQPCARTSSCVTPSSSKVMQCRNLRLLSIAYALCLGLGPDLPWVDERCPGSLRLSVGRILTALFATHTGILTSAPSSCPSGQPSSHAERSPTHACACCDFGSVLQPRIFSAQGLSTSELLRTL